MLKHLSLFAGCGGIDLGFQWAGIKTVAGVEIKQFACDTLKKNHPGIKVFGPPEYEGDVRQFNAEMLREMVGDTEIDIISGGPPCQPFSVVIPLLKQNIEEVINDDLEEKIRDIDKQLAELQIELINVSGDELAVERLGTEIVDLREERQDILTAAAERKDLQLRMQELIDFLDEQHTAITEYSETLTRRLVEKVTILDEKIVVTLKSGMEMEVEA